MRIMVNKCKGFRSVPISITDGIISLTFVNVRKEK